MDEIKKKLLFFVSIGLDSVLQSCSLFSTEQFKIRPRISSLWQPRQPLSTLQCECACSSVAYGLCARVLASSVCTRLGLVLSCCLGSILSAHIVVCLAKVSGRLSWCLTEKKRRRRKKKRKKEENDLLDSTFLNHLSLAAAAGVGAAAPRGAAAAAPAAAATAGNVVVGNHHRH